MKLVDIRELLKRHCAKEVCYFYPNPGNGGDSLITAATFQLLDSLEINYRIINVNKVFDSSGKTILYSGGGNLVKRGKCARNIISKYHKHAKKFILLPHTVDSHEELLQELNENVILVAREVKSFEFLNKNAPNAQVYLSHDMAAFLNVNQLQNYSTPSILNSTFKGFIGHLRNLGASESPPSPLKRMVSKVVQLKAKHKLQDTEILNAFRQDAEKREFQKPIDNIDVSAVFTYGTQSKEAVFTSAYDMLNYLNQFKVVNTDRLHACIGAALLGKQVRFYANDYYKCEEVYKMTLSSFDNIIWKGNEEPQ